jgi:hypothetical protein
VIVFFLFIIVPFASYLEDEVNLLARVRDKQKREERGQQMCWNATTVLNFIYISSHGRVLSVHVFSIHVVVHQILQQERLLIVSVLS